MQASTEKSRITGAYCLGGWVGIETDPEKIEAVATCLVSECVRDLRSYIGLCSYYRRFVKGFAEVAARLHDLTGKYALFEWSEECQVAF